MANLVQVSQSTGAGANNLTGPAANNVTAPGDNNLTIKSVPMVIYLMLPPASVLMVHNHKPSMLQSPAPGVTTPEQQLVCAVMVQHLTPLLVSVLMVHNHNHSLSHSMLQLLVLLHLNSNLSVLMGTAPDATTGLCADGSQPQPQSQSFNATAPGVTTPEQQLVCADGDCT